MERVATELANFWVKDITILVHFVLFGTKASVFYKIDPHVQIHWINQKRKYKIGGFTVFNALRKKIISIKPDAVLSFGTIWNKYVILSLLGTGIPVFISDRGQPGKYRGNFHEWMIKILYPKAEGIIAQTETAKQVYEKKRLNKYIRVIGNPVRKIEQLPEMKRENIILTVGRLIKTKHHDRLIHIFAQLDATDWKLVIVGGDIPGQNRMQYLKSLTEELGVAGRVFFEGEQANVDDYYRKAKIFAFTSSSEGYPNVIAEALSAGLPVVAYDCVAGPSEMIRDGENGFLISVFDEKEFQDKLQLLVKDDLLRKKLSSKCLGIAKDYSIEKVSTSFLNVFTVV